MARSAAGRGNALNAFASRLTIGAALTKSMVAPDVPLAAGRLASARLAVVQIALPRAMTEARVMGLLPHPATAIDAAAAPTVTAMRRWGPESTPRNVGPGVLPEGQGYWQASHSPPFRIASIEQASGSAGGAGASAGTAPATVDFSIALAPSVRR